MVVMFSGRESSYTIWKGTTTKPFHHHFVPTSCIVSQKKYPFHNSYPYVHFSDCMVLGHNLEENPQRMFAINFVYIGSASGIFGEKNLYKDA
jgi:hypothetical protein